MPRIVEALHGLDRYSWVVTAYILATMTMIPLVGKLSDQFGRKWFLLSGATLALSTALQHGFFAVLVFALIALVAAFFLKEVLIKTTRRALSQDRAAQADGEDALELVHAWADR